MPRVSIVSILLLLLLACGGGSSSSRDAFEGPITVPAGGNAPPPGQGNPGTGSGTELDQARQRWIDSGIVNYRYTLQRSAFAPQSFNDPVQVEVRGGQVVAQTNLNTGAPVSPMNTLWWTTIDGLFDFLQSAYDANAASIQVTYDAQLGFPTQAAIDYDFGLADDEQAFTASSLTPLP